MKKIFRFMAVLATVVAALASCAKAEMDAPANEDAAGENVYQGPTRILTFEAQTGTPQTRTSLGDVVTDGDGKKTQPVLWEADDEIKLLYVVDGTEYSVKVTPKSVNGSTAVFEAEVPEAGVDTYYAVYPSSTAAVVDAAAGTVQVTIPEVTTSFKKANIMVAKATSADRTFDFKHAVSIIRFQMGDNSFKQSGEIDRLSLYSGVRGYVLGDVLCSFGEDGEFTATSVEKNTSRYATAEDLSANEVAYVAVWPGYTFEEGFIAYYFNEQRSAYYEKDLTIARGEILNLGNIQDKMRTDFFIKPGAKGDGSSWENAAGEDFIRAFFAKKEDSGRAYAHCQKCENTNFYFAAGTYILGTADAPKLDLYWGNAPKSGLVPIKFYGGCAATEGTDKTRNPETYQTIFSGESEYGILSVRNKADLTLDGITLRDAVITADLQKKDGFYGAALYIGMDTSVTNKDENFFPRVRINNCRFINNKETVQLDNDYGCGSAINLATGKVYVNNTLFSGNISYNRGMIHTAVKDVKSGTSLYINNSRFTGNGLAAKQYGCVIRSLHANTKVGINGCSFGRNTVDSKGGAPVTISSPCIFVNNTLIHNDKDNGYTDAGIYRMASITGVEAVLANNIIMDENNQESAFYWSKGTGGDNFNFKSMSNLCGPQNTEMSFGVMTELSDGLSGWSTTRTGVNTTALNGLAWSETGNYWTWDGNIEGFDYVTAEDMVAATQANDSIKDEFYKWLVEIGAIVDGKFTDCRGYLRAADKMCPGAYDPFATAAE